MLRLFKYLKPYTLLILLAIALLFIQANADLALPDYLSRIVNNGIQQSGVENAVPDAIRKSQMDKLLLLMSDDEADQTLSAYTLIEPTSPDASLYLETYPTLADEAIYVLKDVDSAEIEALNPILGKAFVAVSGIERLAEDPAAAEALQERLGMEIPSIPPGMDIFTLLKMMPASILSNITDAIQEGFAALGESMINQMAVVSVKAEYEALGADMSKIQRDYLLNTGGLMLLVSLLGGICTIAVSYLGSRIAAGFARDIRLKAFEKVENFSSAEFDNSRPHH